MWNNSIIEWPTIIITEDKVEYLKIVIDIVVDITHLSFGKKNVLSIM